MSLFTIKDHQHNIHRTEKNRLENCIAEIYDCEDAACDYRKIEFSHGRQTGLEAFQ